MSRHDVVEEPNVVHLRSSLKVGYRASRRGARHPSLAARCSRLFTSSGVEGWSLAAPALVVMAAVTIAPAVYLMYSSFFEFSPLGGPRTFVGLGNYANVIGSTILRADLVRTLVFVALAVSLEVVMGVLLALVLARRTLGNIVASGLLLIPLAVTPAVAGLVWQQLFNPLYGWIDYYFGAVHVTAGYVNWLGSATLSWAAIVIVDVWEWTPFIALIVMAGVQGLPAEVTEAALVDGAGSFQLLRRITLPLLKPFVLVAAVLRIIGAFQTFATVDVLTGGGPGRSTELLSIAIYRVALQDFNVGQAAALGVLFLVILVIVTSQLLKVFGRNTELVE